MIVMLKRPSSVSCPILGKIQLSSLPLSLQGSSTWGSPRDRRGLAVQSLPLWDAKPVYPPGETQGMGISSMSASLEWKLAVKWVAWSHIHARHSVDQR